MEILLQFIVSILLVFVGVCHSADVQFMRTTIDSYFSEARHHDTNKEYKLRARQFIHDEFKRCGLDTEYQEFFDNYNYPMVTFANVIGVLKGERFGKEEDEILGVAAHYDTAPDTPGVDNNGAGVAAMLEVVRQLTEANKRGIKRQNTIMFVSFDAEELRYIGGEAFTSKWIHPYLKKHYGDVATWVYPYGMIVLDSVMNFDTTKNSQTFPDEFKMFQHYFTKASANIAKDDYEGDFLMLTYRKTSRDSDLASAFLTAWNAAGRPQFEIESFPLPLSDGDPKSWRTSDALAPFLQSDHVTLWADSVPAIFITDSANFRGKMIQCHNKACDDKQNMLTDDNLNFLGKTADAITGTLNTLSEMSGQDSHTNGAMEIRFVSILLQITTLLFGILVLG